MIGGSLISAFVVFFRSDLSLARRVDLTVMYSCGNMGILEVEMTHAFGHPTQCFFLIVRLLFPSWPMETRRMMMRRSKRTSTQVVRPNRQVNPVVLKDVVRLVGVSFCRRLQASRRPE